MAEEIINALSRVRSLFIITRNARAGGVRAQSARSSNAIPQKRSEKFVRDTGADRVQRTLAFAWAPRISANCNPRCLGRQTARSPIGIGGPTPPRWQGEVELTQFNRSPKLTSETHSSSSSPFTLATATFGSPRELSPQATITPSRCLKPQNTAWGGFKMSIEPEGWYMDAGPPSWDAQAKTFSFSYTS